MGYTWGKTDAIIDNLIADKESKANAGGDDGWKSQRGGLAGFGESVLKRFEDELKKAIDIPFVEKNYRTSRD